MNMLPSEGRLREAAGALLQLERDVFALWCRWLFRALDDAGEERARAGFCKAMDSVNSALEQIGGGGPFFLGDTISMVDIVWAPFLERQNASLLFWKGFKLRNGGWDNIDRCGVMPLRLGEVTSPETAQWSCKHRFSCRLLPI